MRMDKAQVEELIREAFRGVSLGDGIGLLEGNGLDDYAGSDELSRLRAQDQRENWEAIPYEKLNGYSTSLSYFDAEGMRFHLPAYLLCTLNDNDDQGSLLFALTNATPDDPRFGLLNTQQRQAIREFLIYTWNHFDEIQRGFHEGYFEYALTSCWPEQDEIV